MVGTNKPLGVREYRGAPGSEVLESIVADVLRNLGFQVETRARRRGRGGGEVEVDVWGAKRVGGTRFFIYASCKNWDKNVDKSVIDEEVGRTSQLIQAPHLKVFVAKSLTDPARETALANGFVVIELGDKASTSNAGEIYHTIHKHLRELFVETASPGLQRIVEEAEEKPKALAGEVRKSAGGRAEAEKSMGELEKPPPEERPRPPPPRLEEVKNAKTLLEEANSVIEGGEVPPIGVGEAEYIEELLTRVIDAYMRAVNSYRRAFDDLVKRLAEMERTYMEIIEKHNL